MRGAEREIATLVERISSLRPLQLMPQAINDLKREAGALQSEVVVARLTSLRRERLGIAVSCLHGDDGKVRAPSLGRLSEVRPAAAADHLQETNASVKEILARI